jgi:hypothetical protein
MILRKWNFTTTSKKLQDTTYWIFNTMLIWGQDMQDHAEHKMSNQKEHNT